MGIENSFNNYPQTPKQEEQGQPKTENQEVLPITESTERTEFTSEEIEKARQEMEIELLKQKKIEIISKVALDGYSEDVNKMAVTINRSVGDQVGDMSIWENMRQQLASSVRQELFDFIGKLKGKSDADSLLGKISKSINQDVFEGPRQDMKIPEAIDHDPGVSLIELIRERGAKLTGTELEDVEDALKLVSLDAQHKFFSWQHVAQLEGVIAAQEELIRVNNEFNPARAGFLELRQVVENGLASIKVDFSSKPNYQYASPEFAVRQRELSRILSGLSKIEAQQFLKDHDIDLGKSSE